MSPKELILSAIARDEDRIIDFLVRLVRAPSPNPPGDTRQAMSVIEAELRRFDISSRLLFAKDEMPNLVADFKGARPGPHLVLNGHVDVFPAGDAAGWSRSPWSGLVQDGYVHGRGAVDMKAGTAALVLAFAYLHAHRDSLGGRLTLALVSDEETGGRYGAEFLLKDYPELVTGDCYVNAEPSSTGAIEVGEKGAVHLRIGIRTAGGHGAYTHQSPNAIRLMGELQRDLNGLHGKRYETPADLDPVITQCRAVIDRLVGKGGGDIIDVVTVNYGAIRGGSSANVLAPDCVLEVDIRMPAGMTSATILASVQDVLARYEGASMEVITLMEPSWSDSRHPMVGHLSRNAERFSNRDVVPVLSLGASDARFWRQRGIPGFSYGPSPDTMGAPDEAVKISEYLHVLKTHAFAACDYLG
jgi:succinyl-diaminopimelate desuccinylase